MERSFIAFLLGWFYNSFNMGPGEEVAELYLKQQGLGLPLFEPDGNIPPDFAFLPQQKVIEVRSWINLIDTNIWSGNYF